MSTPTSAFSSGYQTSRSTSRSDTRLNQGQYGTDLSMMENLFLPYDELVRMGRIAPGEQSGNMAGLSGNQSVFGRDLSSFESDIAASDPVYGAMQREMANNLNFDENGLPTDVSRGILQGVRGSSSARGLLDSGTAGLEEVAALMGGRENLRNNRIAQVSNWLSNTTSGYIDKLFPGMSTIYQGELQRALGRAGNAVAAGAQGASVTNSSTGAIGGVLGSVLG
jgi:hypothetical protein